MTKNEPLFKNEIAFKKHLVQKMRDAGYMVTPIQSRTVPGIPDLFVAGRGLQRWVEVKHSSARYAGGRRKAYKVDFRPGQQAWAHTYHKATGNCVYVVVAFADAVCLLDCGNEVYENGMVPEEQLSYRPGDRLPGLEGVNLC